MGAENQPKSTTSARGIHSGQVVMNLTFGLQNHPRSFKCTLGDTKSDLIADFPLSQCKFNALQASSNMLYLHPAP